MPLGWGSPELDLPRHRGGARGRWARGSFRGGDDCSRCAQVIPTCCRHYCDAAAASEMISIGNGETNLSKSMGRLQFTQSSHIASCDDCAAAMATRVFSTGTTEPTQHTRQQLSSSSSLLIIMIDHHHHHNDQNDDKGVAAVHSGPLSEPCWKTQALLYSGHHQSSSQSAK